MRANHAFALLLLMSLSGCGQAPAVPITPLAAMADDVEADAAYPVENLLGIGPTYGKKLRDAEVKTTADLQKATSTRYARQKLADKTGISYKLVLAWAQKVELMQIKGIGPRQSNLLSAVGVASVKELGQRKADNLQDRMAQANAFTPHFVQSTPSVATVTRWISDAKAKPAEADSDS